MPYANFPPQCTIKRVVSINENKITLEDVQKQSKTYTYKNVCTSITLGGEYCSVTRICRFRLGLYLNRECIIFYDGAPRKNDYVEEVILGVEKITVLVPANIVASENLKPLNQTSPANGKDIIISNPECGAKTYLNPSQIP